MRKTKIICTIGPKTCTYDKLEKLAKGGMNVARLNMSHGDHDWHRNVIKAVRTINEKGSYSVSIMLDTKGPEIRSGDLKTEMNLRKGNKFTFTIRRLPEYEANCTEVNYDGFIDDVQVGDTILIDGGLMSMNVIEKTDTDVICECLDDGSLSSRRHLNIRGKSAKLPSITEKDWRDIDFAIEEGVDFIALSFVKDEKAVLDLKKYVEEKQATTMVFAKIESAESLDHLEDIIDASDGIMVARGDLGSEVAVEEVPLLQEEIVKSCRQKGKPVIVATHLLESMIVNPTPTRAEVADISTAVMQGTDSIMLSGETAAGKHPYKALDVMSIVASRIEEKISMQQKITVTKTDDSHHEIATAASIMANNIGASAILVFTRRGYMASLLSRCRPNAPIHALTNVSTARRHLNIYWGISSYRIQFSKDPEKTIQRAFEVLCEKKVLDTDSKVVIVSDILAGEEMVETIQIRKVP